VVPCECSGIEALVNGPAGSRRYIAAMSEHLRFMPPRVEFDPTLANELARLDG
jgi:hypothetical protein